MLGRYSRPALRQLWSDESRYRRWLDVELAACEAWAEHGVLPADAVRRLVEKARSLPIDQDFAIRVAAIEAAVKHDVIAFTTALSERLGEEGRLIHYGLTSYDVVDTALSALMVEAMDIILAGLEGLRAAVARRAQEYRDTPMVGRTHGVHAEPITFGLKLAVWYAELGRHRERLLAAREGMRVGKLSGAVGTYAHVHPAIEAGVCRRLGLRPAPASTQVLGRDRHAAYVTALAIFAGGIDGFATDLRGLARTEVGEVEEPFAPGQKGSSAMPHKRNPIACEQMAGLARVVRGYAGAALENALLWHERDISNSSAERIVLPDATAIVDYMVHRFTAVVEGMRVYPQRMLENLEATGGLIYSQPLLLALVTSGMSREDAYAWVQAHAGEAGVGGRSFRERVEADPDIARRLGPEGLAAAFDWRRQLVHVADVFRQVGLEGGEGSNQATV
ncbi:MAG TPA: adenylosuccinate lyase [Clostridiales bacterium]|nr:adenylosuccinate lyase [Clostridiales bacterium]